MGARKVIGASYDEALELVPVALKAEGFGILTSIDVKATLKEKLGVDFRRYRILGACNPPLAYDALSIDLAIGTMLPCNVVVYEGDDGRTVVHAMDPTETLAAKDPRFSTVAAQVRDRLARALARLDA